MAEPQRHRLAAGRKKLEEYKMRRKPNQVDSQYNEQATVSSANTKYFKSKDENSDFNNIIELDSDTNSISNSIISNEKYSDTCTVNQPNSALNFFDSISDVNSKDVSNAVSSEKVPLANVLFSPTNTDSNLSLNGNESVESLGHRENVSQNETSTLQNNVSNRVVITQKDEFENDESGDEAISNSEVLKLQEQLQFHKQTVEFLVSEKTKLSKITGELESMIASLQNENADLSGRLNISRHRASCLEMDYSNLKEKHDELNNRFLQVLQDNSKHKETENLHTSENIDLKEELRETKLLISNKMSENVELRKKIEEMTFHINGLELRLQQVNQGNHNQIIDNHSLIEQNQELHQQINILNQRLKELDMEGNQSNMQYQQYVQQLNNQLETMSKKYEALLSENENLMNRESNLMQQMDSLEKQLQLTLSSRIDKSNEDSGRHSQESKDVNKELEIENQNLKVVLREKDNALQDAINQLKLSQNHIEELTCNMNLLQAEKPDIVKLNAANESDRVAAQKATAQNIKLKTELENLQEAYKKMTESKLELVELFQVEKNLTKTLTLSLADNEEKLKEISSKLIAKDEEMIRLQAESSELEKEALKHAQIVDRLNHYEAQNQSSDVLQKELELSKNQLKSVTEENENLKKIVVNLETKNVEANSIKTDLELLNGGEMETKVDCVSKNQVNDDVKNSDNLVRVENCVHIPTADAMLKLQERFTKLMDDVANLSDDKQRLEHIVVQLQGETETIGEYIALYQKQRSILKQREYEKDIQLKLLSQEKLHMKEQIIQLNKLIEDLLKNDENSGDNQTLHNGDTSKISNKIVDLLNDIKSQHLQHSEINNFLENFHPCPWCSGKLINI